MTTHDQLVDWLKSCKCRQVKPVTMRINDEEFIGASYLDISVDGFPMSNKRRLRYYFLGPIPACRRKRQSLCFTNRNRVLYLASYFQKDFRTEYAPFGRSFLLFVWDEVSLGPIDRGERYVYHRVPVEIKSYKPKAKAK